MIDKEKWWNPKMTEQEIKKILSLELFQKIDEDNFPQNRSLQDIICEHTRLIDFDKDEVIVRAGDYGNSAYLITEGQIHVISPNDIPEEIFGRPIKQATNWFKEISKLWTNPSYPEVRSQQKKMGNRVDIRTDLDRPRVFINNFSQIFNQLKGKATLHSAGDVLGEIAALSRTPRAYHFISACDTTVLEIRWQGLHTLRKFNDDFRQKVDQLYRKNSLAMLRNTALFSNLDEKVQDHVIQNTLFESYGEFAWQDDYKKDVEQEHSSLLDNETLIVAEGDYADGLMFIHSGVARVSHKYNHGHRVLKYLNKNDMFGLDIMLYNWKNKDNIALPASLHAVGYTYVLWVPSHILEEFIFPTMPTSEIEQHLSELELTYGKKGNYVHDLRLADGMLDFMSDYRYIIGSASMLIDLNRCVRCDDCVNACAVGHNNNPRFNRHGRIYNHYMVANSCMHCQDPVCMIGCPTGAIHRESTGQITIYDDTCVGCSTCAESCPYDNIRMVNVRDEQGDFAIDQTNDKPVIKATKCDLCVDQLGGPACERACPHDALKRIDFFALSTLLDEVDK